MSLLMGSNSIAHFNPSIEQNKNTDQLLNYVKNSFIEFSHWLANEPNPVPTWNIHWISGKMSRGENQSWETFCQQLKSDASEYFWNCVREQKYIMMVCNKIQLPVAYQNLKTVTIINDPRSQKFLRKSLWYKHYGIKNNKIHLKINDASLYPEPTKTIMKQFDNPVYLNESVYKFYRRSIWNNPYTNFFSTPCNFSTEKNLTINLSDILCQSNIVNVVNQITDYLEACPIDSNYIKLAHHHWINLHRFNY